MEISYMKRGDVKTILVLDKDDTGDVIEAMIHMSYHGQYIVRKATSNTEALYWLDAIPSNEIHMVLLGLSEQENRELVRYMEGVNIRGEYNLVLLTDDTYYNEAQSPLKVEANVSKWPFRLKDLLSCIDRFAERMAQIV